MSLTIKWNPQRHEQDCISVEDRPPT